MPDCPVCLNNDAGLLVTADGYDYYRCATCQALFMPPEQHPDPAAELARYRQHQNDVNDPGYRQFLARLATPLLARLPDGQSGLDYGCGPGPALAGILREAGHTIALYDPFFHPDPAVLDHTYDFIVCTETAEHFHRPASEFAQLNAMLKPGAWLGIMTGFPPDDAQFTDWYYRRDFTHVVFYRPATFQWLAAHHGWACEIPANGVVIMRKRG